MRSFSANNSLQTCRWRICRFELSSTLTGADSGRARRGASMTGNEVTWLSKRRASARTKRQRGHPLPRGTPHTGLSLWLLPNNTLAQKAVFPFCYPSIPPSLPRSPFPPSPQPGPDSLIPGAWPRWCIPGGARERGQQWGARRLAPNPQRRGV